jgi:hypothetical protein
LGIRPIFFKEVETATSKALEPLEAMGNARLLSAFFYGKCQIAVGKKEG